MRCLISYPNIFDALRDFIGWRIRPKSFRFNPETVSWEIWGK